jgi:hypothetical protein
MKAAIISTYVLCLLAASVPTYCAPAVKAKSTVPRPQVTVRASLDQTRFTPRPIAPPPIAFEIVDLSLSVVARTDKTSYTIGEPVHINVSNGLEQVNAVPFGSGMSKNLGNKQAKSQGKQNPNAQSIEVSPLLHINESHTFDGGVTVKLIKVANDSRCPSDVDCIWGGNAVVTLNISHKGETPVDVDLNTDLKPQNAVYMTYDVRLVRLDPYPKSDSVITIKDYAVTVQASPVQVPPTQASPQIQVGSRLNP